MSNVYWVNGKYVQKEDAYLSPLTHTLHYGLGAFEGVRSYEAKNGDVNIFRLKIRRKINSKLPNIKKANNDQIYAAHGSFFIFTNKFVKVENKFNYPVFLFGEEIYIAETAKANGLKTIYYPKLKIYDDEHASTSLMSSKFYRNSNYEALSYILAKYDF